MEPKAHQTDYAHDLVDSEDSEKAPGPRDLSSISVRLADPRPTKARAQRVTDAILSAASLILLAPLFLLIALAIFVTSGRPVIFHQTRLGLGGKPFTMYKFRTIVSTADSDLSEALRRRIEIYPNDPIVKSGQESRLFIPIGHLLRTTSLDELPQFLNVFEGSMSLVGPRLPLPQETVVYTPIELRRLSVMPGMTGLWQVSGRSNLTFSERIGLDLSYIDRRAFWLDTIILLRTLPAVLSRS